MVIDLIMIGNPSTITDIMIIFTMTPISRMIKTVPQIIKKEKGQFLQTFISTFVTSTVSPPPRPGRLEGDEDSLEDLASLESIFGDNFELGGANSLPSATLGPSHTCSVIGGDHHVGDQLQ